MNLSDIVDLIKRGVLIKVDWQPYEVTCDKCEWVGQADFLSEAKQALANHKKTCTTFRNDYPDFMAFIEGD